MLGLVGLVAHLGDQPLGGEADDRAHRQEQHRGRYWVAGYAAHRSSTSGARKKTAIATVTTHSWGRSPYRAVQNTGSKATTAIPEFAPPAELRRQATAARKISDGGISLALASAPRTGISRTKPASTPNAMAARYSTQSTFVAIGATIAASPAAAANGARLSLVRSAGLPSAGCSVGAALSIGSLQGQAVMQLFGCMMAFAWTLVTLVFHLSASRLHSPGRSPPEILLIEPPRRARAQSRVLHSVFAQLSLIAHIRVIRQIFGAA